MLQFGDIDHCKHLTRFHVITDIDANVRQISGDFGEEIRRLESLQRGIGLQPLSHCHAARIYDLDPWPVIRLG